MLVKFTIDAGLVPVLRQAREAEFRQYLSDLNDYDAAAETVARGACRTYMDSHAEFTAARIACAEPETWHAEFEPLYYALERVVSDRQRAHEIAYEEARKFLGLLVWNEALRHPAEWHFTKYPKEPLVEEDPDRFTAEDCWVTHYFAVDDIRANVKLRQAENFRQHGDERRAIDLEVEARRLQEHWRRTR
jgi:hypothetical protein